MYTRTRTALLAFLALIAASARSTQAGELTLLNVSYDPTREVWREVNAAFVPQHAKTSGTELTIKMSHGGSASQARSIIDGLEADVATLALWPDTDAIHKAGLIDAGWEKRLPNDSSPWYSTIVFVVRKGNPKRIKDWPDLVKDGVQVITPNPQTSGNGKLSLLAAWGSVTQRGGSEDEARSFVTELYRNHAPVLDSGARGSTTTFAQKGIGDVHLTWENEAYLEIEESRGKLEIVYPPISVRADPPVAVVDANVKRKGTRAAAEAYLQFLYTAEGQEIIARHHYRPIDTAVQKNHAGSFPELNLFPITAVARDWNDANAKYFGPGGVFESIYGPGEK
jgi:sulfate transport system substrate-binding protein